MRCSPPAATTSVGHVLRDVGQRPAHRHEQRLKRHQRADRQHAVEGHQGADAEHHHLQEQDADAGRPFHQRAEEAGARAAVHQVVDAAKESIAHRRFETEGPHHLPRADVLLHVAEHAGFEVLAIAAGERGAGSDQVWPDHGERKDERGDQRQPPLQGKQQRRADDHIEAGQQRPRHCRHDGVLDRRQVGGEMRGLAAALVAAGGARRQPMELVEDLHAQVAQHQAAHARVYVVAPQTDGRHDDDTDGHGHDQRRQQRRVARHDGAIDQQAEGEGHRRREGRLENQAERDERGQAPVRAAPRWRPGS